MIENHQLRKKAFAVTIAKVVVRHNYLFGRIPSKAIAEINFDPTKKLFIEHGVEGKESYKENGLPFWENKQPFACDIYVGKLIKFVKHNTSYYFRLDDIFTRLVNVKKGDSLICSVMNYEDARSVYEENGKEKMPEDTTIEEVAPGNNVKTNNQNMEVLPYE